MSKHEVLLRLACEQGQSSRTVDQTLNLTGAHPDLIDLPGVSHQLLQLFPVCNMGVPISFDGYDEQVWRTVCEWMISLARISHEAGRRGR